MVELIVGTYGVLCWLLFKKFKVIPVTTYTVVTAILGGGVILALLFISLSVFHPVSHDGRMYATAVQVVPNVRGTVVEVPVKANRPLKAGDVLFRIDPRPFQIEVDRLRAVLAGKNAKFAQLAEQLAAGEAASRQARANLLVSESTYDRQLRETLDNAKLQVTQVRDRLALAQAQYDRAKDAMAKGVSSRAEFDRAEAQFKSLQSELAQAEGDERTAAEKLRSGSSSLEAVRQALAQSEAAERQLRIQLQSQSDGVNPDVRETMAQLERATWELEQTVVRAPRDGYVPQLLLQPGQMATPLPLSPLMVFIPDGRPALIASFDQKAVSGIEPGMEAEAVFKAYPGRSFKVKVRYVLPAIREGELDAGGKLVSVTPGHGHGGDDIPVVFDYEDDVAGLTLPAGSQASVAIYTHRVHVLSLVRKIILRMKSWENYVF